MALYESTGEVRQPKDGEHFLCNPLDDADIRTVTLCGNLPGQSPYSVLRGPRVIMRKVEGKPVDPGVLEACREMLAALKHVASEDDRSQGYDFLIHRTIMESVKTAIARAEALQ